MNTIQALEFFRKPPSDKSEVYRIWTEAQLGEVVGGNQIMAALSDWVAANNALKNNGGVETVEWTLPNGSRFVSSCSTFIRWFFCGLEKVNLNLPRAVTNAAAAVAAAATNSMEDDYDPAEYNRMIVDLDRFLQEEDEYMSD